MSVSTRDNIQPSLPKALAKLLKADHRIEEISDESAYGDGYWLYYEPGWFNTGIECHFVHEWTVKDCIDEHKNIVPCTCKECQRLNEE